MGMDRNEYDYETINCIDEATKEKLYERISSQLAHDNCVPRNIYELKNYFYFGYTNDNLRPKIWKLFLNYFPKNKFKTENIVKRMRISYETLKEKMIIEKAKDPEIDDLINKDMLRVFIEPFSDEGTKRCVFLDTKIDKETHRDKIARILSIFKIVSSSIGYVQGMHMILIPIYYVYATSADREDRINAEKDSFYSFLNLMVEIGENFISEYDNDKNIGIISKLDKIVYILKTVDNEFYNELKRKDILNNHFQLRWVTLLLSNELEIQDVILLWDKLFADHKRFEMVLYCCVAILLNMREELMESNFDDCMSLLQNNKKKDIQSIFWRADKIRRDIKKLENSNSPKI